MFAIDVTTAETTKHSATFHVTVAVGDNEHDFTVTVDSAFHKRVLPKTPQEVFVKKSFEFLLDREPPKDILKTFHLSQIETYFPEFVKEIQKY